MGHSVKTVLHAGCGSCCLPPYLAGHKEVRLDIDPSVKPDIYATITNLGDIGPYDIIYTSHTLEHIYQHEVEKAVSEFHRVLKDGGVAIVSVPDLTDVKCDDEPLYDSPAGMITGRDMYFGKHDMVKDNHYMGHKTGFTRDTLRSAMGIFKEVKLISENPYNIMAIGVK